MRFPRSIALVVLLRRSHSAQSEDLTLWYQQPAQNAMNEALPVGNGRMGGLVLGGVEKDRIVMNEDRESKPVRPAPEH
jgi:alpha-L-fucosidase 2